MNWKEIEKKYPNSSGACQDWLENQWSVIIEIDNDGRLGYRLTDGVHAIEIFIPFYGNRWLYDFFDEQEITCYLNFDTELQIWYYKIIDLKQKWEWGHRLVYNTRGKAEKAVFLKAFELLENKLS